MSAPRKDLRTVHLHPYEIELTARAVAAMAAELRRAGDHKSADLHQARAAEIARAAR